MLASLAKYAEAAEVQAEADEPRRSILRLDCLKIEGKDRVSTMLLAVQKLAAS
jgi:hypothetical protein